MQETVLIIDHNEMSRHSMCQSLEDRGWCAATAESGEAALAHLMNNPVDLVLMNVHLPGMNGFEVAVKVRQNSRHVAIPIVFLSAAFSDDDIDLGRKVSGCDFLTKPVSPRLLCQKVELFLRLSLQERELKALNEGLTGKLQEAQSANRGKSEFLASMSHQIRTPMTGVLGFADMLLDDNLPAESREKVDRIKSSTHSLLHLINNILDLSKLEARKMEIETLDFQLRDLVSDTMGLFQHARRAGEEVKVRLELSDDFPRAIHADPKRIRQILVNLLGNALKFTHHGAITVKGDVIDTGEEGKRIRIAVEDSGLGLTQDSIKDAFMGFAQADASHTRTDEGAGLGLAICKGLSDLMGREIGAESRMEQGSVFWFTWPFVVARTETFSDNKAHSTSRFRAQRRLNILVAENNRINQRIIQKFLENYGHTVTVCDNGLSAISTHIEGNFDLIFMDVRMPEMNGPEATRAIRGGSKDKSEIPIIAFTADAMKEQLDTCFEAGMNGYITKPIDRTQLVQTINEVMDEDIHVPANTDTTFHFHLAP